MKKIILIFSLPLFMFMACGDDDDDDDAQACNDLVDQLNSALDVYADAELVYSETGEWPDGITDLCNAYYDGVIALINEGCENDLGSFEGMTAAQVAAEKSVECVFN